MVGRDAMTIESCEECRGIFHLLKGAGDTTTRTPAKLPAILSTREVSTLEMDARTQKLVNLRKAYERKLPETDENTVEHEHQRGIITGITLAIDVLQGAGIKIKDRASVQQGQGALRISPLKDVPRAVPPRTRTKVARVDSNSLSVMEGILLDVLLARGEPTSKELLGILSLYAPSGPMNTALKTLRESGHIEGVGQKISATTQARGEGRPSRKLLCGDALLAAWVKKLSVMEGELLTAIVHIARSRREECRSVSIDNEEIQNEADYRPSGPYNTAMKRLRNTSLIERGTNHPNAELL